LGSVFGVGGIVEDAQGGVEYHFGVALDDGLEGVGISAGAPVCE
jgi:hypothetical protein